jgi:hypothetical protein
MEPSDSPKRTSPICAVETSSRSLIAGVRVTHDDIEMPASRKTRNSACRRRRTASSMRLLLLGSGTTAGPCGAP